MLISFFVWFLGCHFDSCVFQSECSLIDLLQSLADMDITFQALKVMISDEIPFLSYFVVPHDNSHVMIVSFRRLILGGM